MIRIAGVRPWFAALALMALLATGLAQTETPPDDAAKDDAATDDVATEAQLADRLRQIEGLSGVSVEVTGGVARLAGEVNDGDSRARAAEVARGQPGIVDVRNEVVLGGDVGDRISSAFDRSALKLRVLVGYLPLAGVGAVIVVLCALLARFVVTPRVGLRLAGGNRFLGELLRQVLRFAIILAGLLVALDLLDATALVGAVFGAAGLAGLAIGFAFKDLIENYVASVLLSLRRPFAPNDHVVIGGHEGLVVSLNTRATTLMTLAGNHLRLPNALVFKSVMLNYTRNAERRFEFSVGVGVEEDLLLAQQIGVETMRGMSGVLDDPPPLALLTDLGDSSVVIQFMGWVDQTKTSFPKVKGEAIRLVKLALEAEGMDLPEPTYRVRLTSTSRPEPEPARPSRPARKGAQADVSVDDSLDRQIREEKARNADTDLLSESTPSE